MTVLSDPCNLKTTLLSSPCCAQLAELQAEFDCLVLNHPVAYRLPYPWPPAEALCTDIAEFEEQMWEEVGGDGAADPLRQVRWACCAVLCVEGGLGPVQHIRGAGGNVCMQQCGNMRRDGFLLYAGPCVGALWFVG